MRGVGKHPMILSFENLQCLERHCLHKGVWEIGYCTKPTSTPIEFEHNPSHSYIHEIGSGHIILQNKTDLIV